MVCHNFLGGQITCYARMFHAQLPTRIQLLLPRVYPGPSRIRHITENHLTFSGVEWTRDAKSVDAFKATDVDTDQWCKVDTRRLPKAGNKPERIRWGRPTNALRVETVSVIVGRSNDLIDRSGRCCSGDIIGIIERETGIDAPSQHCFRVTMADAVVSTAANLSLIVENLVVRGDPKEWDELRKQKKNKR